MMTPEQKYNNDPLYHNACEMMESLIHDGRFSPSEMREIAVLACIHYELRRTCPRIIYPETILEALDEISAWRKEHNV